MSGQQSNTIVIEVNSEDASKIVYGLALLESHASDPEYKAAGARLQQLVSRAIFDAANPETS